MPKVVVKDAASSNGGSKGKFRTKKFKIGSARFVSVGPFRGRAMVHIRQYKGQAPTKNGVAFFPKEYKKAVKFIKEKLASTLSETLPLVGSDGATSMEFRDGKICVVVGGGGCSLTTTKVDDDDNEQQMGVVLKKINIDSLKLQSKAIARAIHDCCRSLKTDDDSHSEDEEESDEQEEDEEEEEEEF